MKWDRSVGKVGTEGRGYRGNSDRRGHRHVYCAPWEQLVIPAQAGIQLRWTETRRLNTDPASLNQCRWPELAEETAFDGKSVQLFNDRGTALMSWIPACALIPII